jgi:uncharacterized protein
MALPTPALYAPTPAIGIDASERAPLGTSLIAAAVDEDTLGMRRCELVLGNWGDVGRGIGFALSDSEDLAFGRRLTLTLGAGERRGELFDGAITAVEEHYPSGSAPQLTVLAEDRLQDLRMTRRTRTFEDVTDADVVRAIASEHGLRPEVDLDEVRYTTLAQLNTSDLAFLRERARAVGAEVWVEGDALHAQSRARRDHGAVALRYGADLHEFHVLADLAHQRTAVAVSGWDVAAKSGLDHESGESTVQGELDGDTGGATILARAFGRRVERVVDAVPLGSAETRALAEAHFRERARRFLTGRGEAEGDARIRVGARIELTGLSSRFAGRYHVVEARHRFDRRDGFRTVFGVQRTGLGGGS